MLGAAESPTGARRIFCTIILRPPIASASTIRGNHFPHVLSRHPRRNLRAGARQHRTHRLIAHWRPMTQAQFHYRLNLNPLIHQLRSIDTMGKSQSKLSPEQLTDLQKHTYCPSSSISTHIHH